MKEEHIKYLVCPGCAGELVVAEIKKHKKDLIQEGLLKCMNCKSTYDITRYIPRFVPMENYASAFGFEWTKHAKTQYDSYTGINISETRFFEETKWQHDLKGQTILEVGSGSGRFTEHAAATGAMVVSMDYSSAVDANYSSNGHMDNVLIVQADIYSMPFVADFFDKLVCIGMLQHTPDPKKAFFTLPKYLKPGGSLVIDVYSSKRYLLVNRYLARLLTARIPHETLYKLIERYVNLMWPLVKKINKLPLGGYINRVLFIQDYIGIYPLTDKILKEWAILDTFDIFSPVYEKPQSIGAVKKWFENTGFENIDVHYGYNDIEGRGTKPMLDTQKA